MDNIRFVKLFLQVWSFVVQNEWRGEFLWDTFDAFDKPNVYVLLVTTCHIRMYISQQNIMWRVYSNYFLPYTACQWIFIDLLLWFICLQLARNAKLNWPSDLLKTCKQPVFHLLRCRDSLYCSLFENCHSRKGVQQILEKSLLDALKTKWFRNNTWPLV